jgi:hypothetical protein
MPHPMAQNPYVISMRRSLNTSQLLRDKTNVHLEYTYKEQIVTKSTYVKGPLESKSLIGKDLLIR